jgi:hypothetical protein
MQKNKKQKGKVRGALTRKNMMRQFFILIVGLSYTLSFDTWIKQVALAIERGEVSGPPGSIEQGG